MTTFEFDKWNTIENLVEVINLCESQGHFQQVVYSTHARGITQLCFDCKKIRSTIVRDME